MSFQTVEIDLERVDVYKSLVSGRSVSCVCGDGLCRQQRLPVQVEDMDRITTIDISYSAPWHQRNGYENTISLICQ